LWLPLAHGARPRGRRGPLPGRRPHRAARRCGRSAAGALRGVAVHGGAQPLSRSPARARPAAREAARRRGRSAPAAALARRAVGGRRGARALARGAGVALRGASRRPDAETGGPAHLPADRRAAVGAGGDGEIAPALRDPGGPPGPRRILKERSWTANIATNNS